MEILDDSSNSRRRFFRAFHNLKIVLGRPWLRIKTRGFRESVRQLSNALVRQTFYVFQLDSSPCFAEPSASPNPPSVEILEGEPALQRLRILRRAGGSLPVDFYRDQLNDTYRSCLVAVYEGQLAGVLWAYDHARPGHFVQMRPGDAEVRDVYCLAKFRGKGIAKMLISLACTDHRKGGVERIFAVIHSENEASKRAFMAVGFRRVAALKRRALFGPKFKPERMQPNPTTIRRNQGTGNEAALALSARNHLELPPMNIELSDNEAAWNRAILELSGTLYHSWEWGEVRRAEGWLTTRALLKTDGKAVAAVQILERRLPMGMGTILYIPRGIAGADNDPATVARMVAWLKRFVLDRRPILLRMDPSFLDSDQTRRALLVSNGFRALPDEWSLWNLPRATMVLDIFRSEEDILRNMRRTHRQLIQRAVRDGLEVEAGTGMDHLRDFYSLVLKSSKRQGFALRGMEHFLNIRKQFCILGDALFFLCRQNGRAVAAIFCGCFGTTCHYFHGGFDVGLRAPGATEILHWKAIQWARGKGCKYYDLLGSATPHPPKEGNRGYGLYNYKKGFGADLLYSAGYFDLAHRSSLYRVFRFMEEHPSLIEPALKARSIFQ